MTATKTTCIATFFALLALGCGRGGLERVDINGTITWNGQPIPRGYIVLTPDPTKGNDGPQGTAYIEEGKYDTRGEKSKAPVKGPQTVEVMAYTNQNISRMQPYGDSMFADRVRIEIDIPPEGGEINLTIPD